jgi:hypothetical protein
MLLLVGVSSNISLDLGGLFTSVLDKHLGNVKHLSGMSFTFG